MNKKLRIILNLIMAVAVSASCLAFTACGNSSGNNSGYQGGIFDDKDKDEFKYTVLSRAKELVDNVDKLPNLQTVMTEEKNPSNSVARKKFKSNIQLPGVSSPDDLYFEHSAYEVYYSNLWSFAEQMVNDCKELKNRIVDIVRQPSVWVNMGYNQCKLNYDINADIVTVEFREDMKQFNSQIYTKIISNYTVDGKINITVNTINYTNGRHGHSATIHYLEDEIWTFTMEENQYYENVENNQNYKYVIEADLTSENGRVTQISRDKYFCRLSMNINNNGLSVVTSLTEGTLSFNVYDETGKNLSSAYYPVNAENTYNSEELNISLAVFKLDGWGEVWDKIYYGTNSGEYKYGNDEKCVLNWRLGVMASGVTSEPALDVFIPNINEEEKSITEILSEFLNSINLSINDNYLNAIYNGIKCCDKLSDWQAFDINNITNSYNKCFNEIYNKYNNFAITKEEFLQKFAEPFIESDAQTEINEVFALLDLNVQGNVKLDAATGELDFSGVSLNVPKSILFAEGKEYSFVITLKGNSDLIDVDSVSAIFDGNDFVLQGFTAKNVKNLISNGNYTVVAYLAKNIEGKKERLSEFFILTSDKSAEYSQQWQEKSEEENIEYVYDYTYTVATFSKNIEVSQNCIINISKK